MEYTMQWYDKLFFFFLATYGISWFGMIFAFCQMFKATRP